MKNVILVLAVILSIGSYGQGYFQQEVNYKIDVSLNDVDNTLSAFEEFEYTNNSGNAMDMIYVHLWPNGYKNTNTALGRQLYHMGDMSLHYADEDEKGWIDSLDFKVNGEDVKWEYHPDYIDICIIHLNSVLKPGDKMTVTTPFKVKIPSGDISRLGHVGESYQITQWYPKPAVFDQNGWHEMPYLTQGEFYSEFGSFDVSITLPKNYVVGATGDLQTESEIAFLDERVASTKDKYENDGFKDTKKGGGRSIFPDSEEEKKTIRFTQNNVHDFAWFADKRFEVLKGEVKLPHSDRTVTTWAMFVPHHHKLWENSLEYLHDGTYYYSLWNGDYPYNNVTAVDGTISAGGGMEYPNVTVIGNASNELELEVVIVHEVGHNWFYGLLGSNEREHAWMDEGLNTLNEIRYIETKYPKNERLSDMMQGMAETVHLEHLSHRDMNDMSYSMTASYGIDQPIELPSDEYKQLNYGAIVYSKTGLVFTYLRDYLGDEEFDKGMRAYYDKWHYKHPQPKDLQNSLEESSGKDLSWLFDDIIPTTAQIDYKIVKVKKDENGTTVTIRNTGQIAVPVRVDALNYGKIRDSKWVEPTENGTAEVHFDGTTYDQFIIDEDQRMPEVHRNNNYWKEKGFHRVERFQMEFLGGDNEPDKWNSWYTPILGGNKYDKFMVGFMFHNITMPKNKFEYTLAPMFSVGRKNLAGFGNLNYSWVPRKNIKMITIGITGKTFGNGLGFTSDSTTTGRGAYYVTQPYVDFQIGKPDSRTFYKQELRLQGLTVLEGGDLYSNTTYGGFLRYKFKYAKGIHEFGAMVRTDYFTIAQKVGIVESESDLLNAQVELKYKINYWESKGKHIEIRAFLGQNLFYNGTQDARYGFALTGQNGTQDAMYEHYMMGRNEFNGLWANQRIDNHGGFKSTSNYGTSTSMIIGTNLIWELPYLPFIAYGDFGMFDDNGTMETVYDAGLGIKLGNIFAVYFPLYESDNLKNSYPSDVKYGQKIRFTLNMSGLNPTKIIQNTL